MKYVDPDGRVDKHSELTGKDRSRAEFKDIFEASFKTGIFAELEISFWEIFNAGLDINLGSVETTGDLNNSIETSESISVSGFLGIFEVLEVGIDISKSKVLEDEDFPSDYFSLLGDVIENGENDVNLDVDILGINNSTSDPDTKASFSIGLCVGIGLSINLSELKDYFKGKFNGDY